MIKYIYFIALALLSASCMQNTNHETHYTIITDANADSLTVRAAMQLQNYWNKVSTKEIDIAHSLEGDKRPIFIGSSFLSSSQKESLQNLKNDGFLISINDDSIFLAGKSPIGNIYAVNTLLEEHLGIIKFSASEEFIPQKTNLKFQNSFKVYNPAFEFRRTLFPAQKDKSYREWYKLEELEEWGMFVHTFRKLIPPEKYYDTYPEYFSFINGRRLKDAQLCLSNPEVIETLIVNLGEEMKKQPEKIYWSVSQNDAINYCECSNCKALYKKYNSFSGAYIQMANQIARTFPDKQISTLAYQFTRSAPQNIKPDSNVNIMFCSIECNRGMPLNTDHRSADFVKDMTDWSKLSNNIFVWDYVVQFKNYLAPFPNFPVLQPNIQFFHEQGVEMMFQQGSGGNWSDLSELKQYLIAKLLWNPQANEDSLIQNFVHTYYGDAGKYIMQYYELTSKEMKRYEQTEFLNIYGFPSDYTDSFLSPQLIIEYKQIMDKAQEAVSHDSTYLNRVKRTRLAIDFAYVDIAINNNFDILPSIINQNSTPEINPEILQLLQNMLDYAATDKLIKINERNFKLLDYKEYALNKMKSKLLSNKLQNANITLKTKHSETYPVGGAKALNDKLFGSLDFHHNWLGFQGEDMLVEIELEDESAISEIQMNFLKAVNSWVFLPISIQIESSIDGIDYQVLQSIKDDKNNENYLVKSIPYIFNFDKTNTKYLRITAESIKTCPEWHRGFGNPSWIFIDEILVN